MFSLLNKISKGATFRYFFKGIKKRYLFRNHQTIRLFSSQINSIDSLLSKLTLAEKEQDANILIGLYNQLGSSYGEKGDLHQSTVYYEKAVKTAENKFGPSFSDLRTQYINLGNCYRSSEFPEKSIEWYEKALNIEKSMFGEQSREVAETLTDLIPVYRINNDIEKAEQAVKSALPYMESQKNTDNGSVATYFLCSGNYYSAKDDPTKAIESFKISRKIFKNLFGQFAIEVAICDEVMGMDYWKLSDLKESERHLQSAINIRENLKMYDIDVYKKLALLYKQIENKNAIKEIINKAEIAINEESGKNSSELVKFYVDLGEKFKSVNEPEISRELYAKSFEAIKQIPDQASMEIASYYEYIAAEANDNSEFDKVIDCINSSIAIKNSLGMAQKDIVQHYSTLGYAYYYTKDFEKSEKFFLQAKEILDQENLDSEKLIFCLKYLSTIYRDQERFPEAEAVINRIITIKSQTLGNIHNEIAVSHAELGFIYKLWGKKQKSVEEITKAIDINNQVLGKNNLDNSGFLAILGGLYWELKEFDKAVITYKTAIEIRNEIVGEKDSDLGSFYHALAEVYKDMGNHDKAFESFEKGLQSDLRCHGDNDVRVGWGYIYIGELYEKIGNKSAAIENLQKAQQIFASFPGEFAHFMRIQSKLQELNKNT